MQPDRRWTDADREMAAAAIADADMDPARSTPDDFATAVLDTLTAAGWRNLRHVSGYEIDGEIHHPRDVQIWMRPERSADAR